MIIKRITSAGLSHFSYLICGHGTAAVIDPRRDDEIYVKHAARENCRITHIFETHRNEDYLAGSTNLAARTGAEIFHSHNLDFHYGNSVREGTEFDFGSFKLRIIDTPGHSDDGISLVLTDSSAHDTPVAVFSGDSLFIGSTARTDFSREKAAENAGKLYDSITQKILPLGDGVLLYPAHGAGSACGSGMSRRMISSLGIERRTNKSLWVSRNEFIQEKLNEHHYTPPYFAKMHEQNRLGPVVKLELPAPQPLSPRQFDDRIESGMAVIDIRGMAAFSGAHIPGSLSLPLELLARFAGWLIPYDTPIGIVANDSRDVAEATRRLFRIGYDNVAFWLGGGMAAWAASGRPFGAIRSVHITELEHKIDWDEEFTLLDVRSEEEFEKEHLEGAVNIYIGELPGRVEDISKSLPVITFCGTGRRAMIAASILKRNGFDLVETNFGSMAACKAVGCIFKTAGKT